MGWIDREENWLERPREELAPAAAPAVREAGGDPPNPVVRWVPVRCPYCKSRDAPVTASPKMVPGLRYHRCQDCGGTFKSFEIILGP